MFSGSSTNPICYYSYKDETSLNSAILRYKEQADRTEKYKADRKKRTGFLTGPAACSAAIKAELKNVFPHIKFSVTSETFSGGDAVRIHWTDGVTESEVKDVVKKYQYGHFDGMTDMYEYSNSRDDLPQAKYITTSREQSEETSKKLVELMEPIYSENTWGCYNIDNLAHRLFYATSFPKNGTIKSIEKTGATMELSDINVFYKVVFEGQEEEFIDWSEVRKELLGT